MNLRISTGMMHRQSLMNRQASEVRLAHLNNQLSSQKRMLTAKDDPVAAGTAMGLERNLAALEQYGKNANFLQSRLGLQENVLQEMGEVMNRVNDLTLQANNDMLSDKDRQAISIELKQINQTLMQLANSDDGRGRYLFAGAADDAAPFAKSGGKVSYNGDQFQHQVEIAPDTLVKGTQTGLDLFMRIRTGDGSVDARPEPANTGTGVVLEVGRSGNAGTWNGESYTVKMGEGQQYSVLDKNGAEIASGVLGSAGITFAGLRIKIEGEPAEGDSFSIGPAGVRDVFATIDNLIGALEAPVSSAHDRANLRNVLQSSLRDLSRVSEHFISARATGGAQLSQIDSAARMREAHDVTQRESLSAISDLDVPKAIDDLNREQLALQIAQTIFMKMQGMSLLERMR